MITDYEMEKVMHFSRAYQHFLLDMDNAAAGEDFSGAEARCLMILAFHKKRTLVELSNHYGADLAFLSRLTKRLEKRCYILREPNPEDGRSIYLSLTEKGFEQIPKLKDRIRKYFKTVFGDLSGAQVSELLGYMQGIDGLLQKGKSV